MNQPTMRAKTCTPPLPLSPAQEASPPPRCPVSESRELTRIVRQFVDANRALRETEKSGEANNPAAFSLDPSQARKRFIDPDERILGN